MTSNTLYNGDVIRVFARRTSYTPTDELAFIGEPPLYRPTAKEVHISIVFTWDKKAGVQLAESWARYYPTVKVGGPAFNDRGGDFIPGLYLKYGEVVTSRGCPNSCPYCFVPKREGALRLLPIREGWDVLDNNLLACPYEHIKAVFDMLEQQNRKVMFRGGLEASRIDEWFVGQLARVKVASLWLAYDSESDREACVAAIGLLRSAGYNNRQICCYMLVGFGGDTPEQAQRRLEFIRDIGAMPFAMYYRAQDSETKLTPPPEWQVVVRPFCRPTAIFAKKQYA